MMARWSFRLKPEATRRSLLWLPALAGRLRRFRRGLILAVLAIATAIWLRCGPLPDGLLQMDAIDSTVVVDRNGIELYEALGSDGTRSRQLRPETIPEIVAAATVAAEDRRFWSHHGIDPIAVVRAVKQNVAEGTTVQGGSTITQQTAKLLRLRRAADRRRGWRTKLSEAVIALRLEHRLSKREILALYLNLASYGNQTTGFARASRLYFGVGPDMLTAAQAAFLAGLPQRPSTFNPYRSQALAISRQRVVLARMAAAGLLNPARLEEARAERLTFSRQDRRFLAPHFVEMVLSGAGPLRPNRIETTLDARLQEDVAGILRTHRPVLDRHGAANVAVVVLDNVRNEWLAWEGSGDYFDDARGGTINGPLMPRQPGSALKPFTYALAFEKGFTPVSVLPDVPLNFPTAQPGIVYSPRNYDGRYRGPLLARAALAGSENVPAVSLASEVGIPDLLRFLRRAGFTTFDRTAAYYGLGLTLGNAEVRLDELVAAYAAFARNGEWRRPTCLIDRSVGAPGQTAMLVSPRTAFWIGDILADADARAYIFGRGSSLELPFEAAVKTGTSQAYHDNWTIGFTRRVTVGVWVGNFDRRPLRNSSGVTGAAPIFQAVMLAAHRRIDGAEAALAPPETGLERRDVCGLSGEAASPWCPVRRREWLPLEHQSVPCSWHLSAVGSAKVDHLADEGVLTVWPAEFREWAGRHAAAMARPAAESSREPAIRRVATTPTAATRSPRAEPAFRLANPPTGATYLIDPTLRPEFQTLPLRVVSASPTRVEWSVNGSRLGEASSESPLEWRLRPGRHSIVARDARGNVAESVVVVR
jgi:penicillin-binding protein 1C